MNSSSTVNNNDCIVTHCWKMHSFLKLNLYIILKIYYIQVVNIAALFCSRTEKQNCLLSKKKSRCMSTNEVWERAYRHCGWGWRRRGILRWLQRQSIVLLFSTKRISVFIYFSHCNKPYLFFWSNITCTNVSGQTCYWLHVGFFQKTFSPQEWFLDPSSQICAVKHTVT